jgi:glucosamine--fructose-6-phosphate aminotransferase (isomerizing)
MTELATHMAGEIAEAPEAVARMLATNAKALAELGRLYAERKPSHVVTCARGSSDCAASYFKYLIEITLGLPCCSIGASVVSVYGARLALRDTLLLTISQSGQSPDILAFQAEAKRAGIPTLAVTNTEDSPLAREADLCLPLCAGLEQSVAATKSFICSLVCVARLIALWRGDRTLAAALERLPERLEAALACDWSGALPLLAPAHSLYVVGRGLGFGIAHEWALKLKETSGLHAEALSAAEVQHGPRAVIERGFPVLALALDDPAGRDAAAFATELAERGHTALVASARPVAACHLPLPPPLHPLLDPIVAVQAFYPLAAMLAETRGLDPDQPRGLHKVTTTL